MSAVAGSSEEFQNGRMAMDCRRQGLVVLCPSIIDAGLSSSVLGEEYRTLNPGPPAFQCPDSITVRVLHRDLCAQPCARRGSIKPASGRRLKQEAPDWGIPHGPHEVSSGGHRLHEAGRGGLTGRGSLDQRCLADWQKLTAIRRAAKSAVKISIEFKHQKRWHRCSLTPFATRKRHESRVTSGARGVPQATQRR